MSTTSTTPASDAFMGSLTSMVNHDDISAILEAQTQMLSRFEKTNEMLSNFNNLSAARYEKTLEEFKEHTQTLMDMRKDLESVFRRIRYAMLLCCFMDKTIVSLPNCPIYQPKNGKIQGHMFFPLMRYICMKQCQENVRKCTQLFSSTITIKQPLSFYALLILTVLYFT